jgi:hypothetical protein
VQFISRVIDGQEAESASCAREFFTGPEAVVMEV